MLRHHGAMAMVACWPHGDHGLRLLTCWPSHHAHAGHAMTMILWLAQAWRPADDALSGGLCLSGGQCPCNGHHEEEAMLVMPAS